MGQVRTDVRVREILGSFVLRDCRLSEHPEIAAHARFLHRGSELRNVAEAGGLVRELPEALDRLPVDPPSGLSGYVFMRNQYCVVSDMALSPFRMAQQPALERSFLGLPIPGEGPPLGVLSFSSQRQHFFGEADIGRAALLASVLAYSVQPPRGSTAVARGLGQALRQARLDLGMTQEKVADLCGTSRVAVSRWEAGSQPPSYGPLKRWLFALGLLESQETGLVTVVDVSDELLRLLRRNPEELGTLTPAAFEGLVADRLDKMGYEVNLTGDTAMRDGGIDLIAVPRSAGVGSYLLAGQAKHHRSAGKTGRPAVDRLLSWKDRPFRLGLLVTNTFFTKDALWLASQDPAREFLRLRDFDDLKRWLADEFWSPEEWRELPDAILLAPGVEVQVPKVRLEGWRAVWPRLKGITEEE